MLNIWDEERTLEVLLTGRSITRYGEGELRYCIKSLSIKSQVYDERLGMELLKGLKNPHGALVGLPRLWKGMPQEKFWFQFAKDSYTAHLKLKEYGSAFISRPDMAIHIDKPAYWADVKKLWTGQDVTLIGHSSDVLPLAEANSVKFIKAPPVGAFAEINRIEEEAKTASGPVLMCLGATATALAIRLAKHDIQALDLGHLGAFMPHAGAFSVGQDDLISPEYVGKQRALHKTDETYGHKGHKQSPDVKAFAERLQTPRLIDYGCGQGSLKKSLQNMACKTHVVQYDPCVKDMERIPKPVEMVVAINTLEHVEPAKLNMVLRHISALAMNAGYFVINLTLDRPSYYWAFKLKEVGFKVDREEVVQNKDTKNIKFWCSK